MVRSAELVASHLPSGLNVQQRTLSSWPVRVCWRDPTKSLLDEDPPMFTTFDTTPAPPLYQPHPPYGKDPCTSLRRAHTPDHSVVLATIVTKLVNFWSTKGMETSNYRHKAYHKTGYQMPATTFPMATTAAYPLDKNNRLVAHFAYPGVEKNSGVTGFAYGSDKSYTNYQDRARECKHRLDDRTWVEVVHLSFIAESAWALNLITVPQSCWSWRSNKNKQVAIEAHTHKKKIDTTIPLCRARHWSTPGEKSSAFKRSDCREETSEQWTYWSAFNIMLQ